jgi:hypothetical protein
VGAGAETTIFNDVVDKAAKKGSFPSLQDVKTS